SGRWDWLWFCWRARDYSFEVLFVSRGGIQALRLGTCLPSKWGCRVRNTRRTQLRSLFSTSSWPGLAAFPVCVPRAWRTTLRLRDWEQQREFTFLASHGCRRPRVPFREFESLARIICKPWAFLSSADELSLKRSSRKRVGW